jgi:general secretion pathway protein J
LISRPHLSALRGSEGFTLIETLIAMVLLGLVLGSLVSISAEWLPNWKRALFRARSSETIAIALDRLVSDLSATQYVSVSSQTGIPFFQGDEQSVTFIRSAIGPNGSRGLEFVRIAEITDSRGPALVRMRAPFTPRVDGNLSIERIPFVDPVVLLRSPLHIIFGFARNDGKWLRTWPYAGILPTAVRFVVQNEDADRTTLISTVAGIQVNMMPPRPDVVAEPPAAPTSASPNGTSVTQ